MTDYVHTLTNPGAEIGDLTGWASDVGTPTIRTATPSPHTGTYYFGGGSADAETKMSQEVDLETDGVPTADIDSGSLSFQVNWYQSSYAKEDDVAVILSFKDAAKAEISEVTSDLWATEDAVWTDRESRQAIPTLTRYIDVIIQFDRDSGTANNGYVDDITCKTITTPEVEIFDTDFTEYAASSAPSDWSGLFGGVTSNLDITVAKKLEITGPSGSSTPVCFVWDDIGRVQDSEILVKWQPTTEGYPDFYDGRFAIVFRANGTADQPNYYSFNTGNNTTVITKNGIELGSGTYPTGDQYYDITLSETDWYYTRILNFGSSIKAKIWNSDDEEPDFWPLEHTDTGITDPGYIGVGTKSYAQVPLVDEFRVYTTDDNVGNLSARIAPIFLNNAKIGRSWIDSFLPAVSIASHSGSKLNSLLPELLIESHSGAKFVGFLPELQISADIANAASLYELLPAILIEAGTASIVNAILPEITLTAYQDKLRTAQLNELLPAVILDSHMGSLASLKLPTFSLEAYGMFLNTMTLDCKLPTFSLKAYGMFLNTMTLDRKLPTFSLEAMSYSNYIHLNCDLPPLRIKASAYVNHYGNLNCLLSGIIIAAKGHPTNYAVLDELLPAILIDAVEIHNYVHLNCFIPCITIKSSGNEDTRFDDDDLLRYDLLRYERWRI